MIGRILPALVAGLLTLVVSSPAQTPFSSSTGVTRAEAALADSLGSGAVLVGIISAGIDPYTGGAAFDIETGLSTIWIFRYYSPSQDKGFDFVVLQPVPGVFTGEGASEVDPPDVDATKAIDTTGSFANSDRMAAAIRSNGVYQLFRQTYGSVVVPLLALARGDGSAAGLPANDAIWTVTFSDDDDTTRQMACFVAASTGETFCLSNQTTGIDAARDAAAGVAAAGTMTVAPNPSSGRTRVTLDLEKRQDAGAIRVGLYDLRGALVLDLTPSFRANGGRFAELDASALPAGTYFCRASGAGAGLVVGTLVVTD